MRIASRVALVVAVMLLAAPAWAQISGSSLGRGGSSLGTGGSSIGIGGSSLSRPTVGNSSLGNGGSSLTRPSLRGVSSGGGGGAGLPHSRIGSRKATTASRFASRIRANRTVSSFSNRVHTGKVSSLRNQ